MKLNFKKIFSAFSLKIICLLFMTAGIVLIQLYGGSEGLDLKRVRLGYNIYYVGVPIACFLVAEGALRTGKIKKYILRLFFAAILTELVFDYARMGNDLFDFSGGVINHPALKNSPNFFFTLLFGLICTAVMEYGVSKHFKQGTVRYNLLNLLIIIAGVAASYFLNFEHGGIGVLMVIAMYLFHENRILTLIAIAAIQIVLLGSASGMIMYTPVVGTIFTWFYSGEEGAHNAFTRLLFYSFFPIVFVILVLMIKTGIGAGI